MSQQTRIVVPKDEMHKDSPHTVARAAVARSANDRQSPKNRKPAAPVMRYRVTYLGSMLKKTNGSEVGEEGEKGVGVSHTVNAVSEAEAWAKYCDLIKSWPSPKQAKRTIECLGPVAD